MRPSTLSAGGSLRGRHFNRRIDLIGCSGPDATESSMFRRRVRRHATSGGRAIALTIAGAAKEGTALHHTLKHTGRASRCVETFPWTRGIVATRTVTCREGFRDLPMKIVAVFVVC